MFRFLFVFYLSTIDFFGFLLSILLFTDIDFLLDFYRDFYLIFIVFLNHDKIEIKSQIQFFSFRIFHAVCQLENF